MKKEIKSEAKRKLIELLRNFKFDEPLMFTIGEGEHPDSFISRMRTELSRLRTQVRDAGRPVKQFKMLVVNKQRIPGGHALTIKFVKQIEPETLAEIKEIFPVLIESALEDK